MKIEYGAKLFDNVSMNHRISHIISFKFSSNKNHLMHPINKVFTLLILSFARYVEPN